MPRPTMVFKAPIEYARIPYLEFAAYDRDEWEAIRDAIRDGFFPTKVELRSTLLLEAHPWEVVISVTADVNGYPSDKEISIQPGQMVIWFGSLIYVMSQTKTGTTQVDTYRHPGIQDVDTGGRL